MIQRFISVIVLSLFVGASALAQVRELWRTDVSHIDGLRARVNAALVDDLGATIIGGRGPVIAKFDTSGQKVWDLHPQLDTAYGVESLAVDVYGNIFATAHHGSDSRALLLKISPDGQELWRAEQGLQWAPADLATSVVNVDAQGNSFFCALNLDPASDPPSSLLIAKLDPQGSYLWRTILPGYWLGLMGLALPRNLTVLADGSLVVVGRDWNLGPVVVKIGSDGNVLWLAQERKGLPWSPGYGPPAFYSVWVSQKGRICTCGPDRFAVFSPDGRTLQERQHGGEWAETVGETHSGGFVFGGLFTFSLFAVNAGGQLQWAVSRNDIRLPIGTVPASDDLWISAGVEPAGLRLLGVAAGGSILWEQLWWQNHPLVYPAPLPWFNKSLFRSSNGTFRVVVNTFEGFRVAAFEREP